METIEQLKQDNTKLQERLNNAAKFFREQKAQIETLTKENEELKLKAENFENVAANKQKVIEKLEEENKQIDELKHDADCFNSLQESYENDIKSKDQALKVLQETYNEVFAEKEKLTEQIKVTEKTSEEEKKKIIEARDQWKGMYTELESKIKEYDIARGQAELRLENIQIEYTNKFDEQNKEIEELKQKINAQQAQYNTLKEQNEDVINDRNEIKEKLDKFNQSFINYETEKSCLEDDYRKLNEKYESLVIQASVNERNAAKYEEIREEYEKYKEFINALQTKAKEVNIVWASPDEIAKQEKPKKENNEQVKKSNKEGRIINQEMAVQGGMTINM